MTFLGDPKTQTAIVGFLATIMIQFLHAHNVDWIDAQTANALCLTIVGLAATLMASHAHETASENHSDAAVSVAQITARGAVTAAQQTPPTEQTVTVNATKSP